MLITIRLSGKELKEIEELVLRGDIDSVHDFIKYAIRNQLELEKDRAGLAELREAHLPKSDTKVRVRKEDNGKIIGYLGTGVKTLRFPPIETTKFVSLDTSRLLERTKYPLWALKNKYFPLKFVLRVIQKIVSDNEGGKIPVNSLQNEIKELAFQMREEMEYLDKRLGYKRGYKIATGFPTNDDKSFNRFFNNFVVYISPDGNTIKGMLYEVGFVDIVDGNIILTEDGNNFAKLYSPIIDGYFQQKEFPGHPFSEEELNFLYDHIKQKVISEATLYLFMLSQIEKGVDTPEGLNHTIKPFLDERFPKHGGYSIKSANSIRAGLTSRMVELKLIRIVKKDGRTFYKIEENGKEFKEGAKEWF